ncbi:regulator of telomere elongation helicase 1 homolog [Babylonia areolata]|uniref:regulator of telomere elongation helicase 1 homolog n=1 Tax=Babylonia areolata TaxID=304850 RepID=UPI003FD1FD9D
MSLLDIKGVRVTFPFQPYPCQVTYMEKVLQCLQKEENGVLESPTGTGKTLCLLCSSLAWLESRKAQVELSRQAGAAAIMAEAGKENLEQSALAAIAASLQRSTGSASWGSNEFVVPKIIYASRTHSQLSQAVQELKRTAYNTSVKTAIIGSREQLCVNEQVKKEKNNSTKVHLCRAKVSARRCHYYNVLEDLKRNTEARQIVGSVTDIEDLVSHGSKSKICPYYLARELKSDADIIFMPYNYLLDPKSRKAHGIELQGNIIIFDEAHNLERICEESASFELSSVDLATAIEETTQLGVRLTELVSSETDMGDAGDGAVVPEFTLEDIIKLKKTLLELEELIDAEPLHNMEATKPGMFMFELMAKVNITFSSKSFVIDLMDKMISHLNTDGTSSALHSKGAGLSKVVDAFKIIFNQEPGENCSVSQHRESLAQHYKVHIQQKDSNSYKKKKLDSWASTGAQDKSERVLSYWCFSPGYSMQELKAQGVKSIILTSGTLSPIDSFTGEMQIPFSVRLENPHVIEKHQVWVGTLACGPDGAQLNSNYQNRFTDSYQSSLGNSIVNFARVVPNGLLVFFPSYPVMEKCVETWQNSNVWDRIMAYKPVVLEPRGKDAFTQAIDDFYEKINDSKLNGAIFMAVCRGKVSEGLDFADMNGRAVILTGLPFPPMKDPRVILKMQHLDSLRGKQGFVGLTGQQWYRQQATRAVNQAIGRVIRHKDDFGAIMLCDSRFSSTESVNGLPMWVKPHVTKYDSFGRAVRDMLNFFKVAEKTLPAPVARHSGQKGGSGTGRSCVGAYFEPTTSRHVGTVQQASDVTCHVPGFSKQGVVKNQEDILASLRSQYSGPKNDDSVRKRGLLQALDTMEKCTEPCLSASETHQPAEPRGTVKIQTKRRKIVIKAKNSAVPPLTKQQPVHHGEVAASTAPGPSTTTTTSTSTSSGTGSKAPAHRTGAHQQLAEHYLAEVKAVLTLAEYRRFSSTLQEYKKSGSLSTVTPVLADLFTSDSRHFHLFRKFYRFVRPGHKAEFDQLCVSLTGESCGYKPEHAVTSKRLVRSTDASEPSDKPSKLTSACGGSSTTLGQWSAANPATTSHSSSVAPPASVQTHGSVTCDSTSSSVRQNSVVKPSPALVQKTPNLDSAHDACQGCYKAGDQNCDTTVSKHPSSHGLRGKSCTSSTLSSCEPCVTENVTDSGTKMDKPVSDSCHPDSANSNHADGSGRKRKSPDSVVASTSEVTRPEGQVSCPATRGSTGTTSGGNTPFDVDKIRSMSEHVNKVLPKSGYRCCKCSQEAQVPFSLNQCEHVCCFKCWRIILEGDKRCPGGCGQTVKRRNLQQVMFASGGDLS